MNYRQGYQQALTDLAQLYIKNDRETFRSILRAKRIQIKEKGNILKVKYQQSCPFDEKWTLACRGTMFFEYPDRIQIVYSLNKFFNAHQLPTYFGQTAEEMGRSMGTIVLMPKYDGSNIQVFFDTEGHLHIYTLGSLDEKNPMQANSPSFNEAAEELLPSKVIEFLQTHPLVSIIFELMTNWNVIVTKYKRNWIMPLVCIEDGLPTWNYLSDLFPEHFSHGRPKRCWETTADRLLEDVKTCFEEMVADSETFGANPEGLVGFTDAIPWVKFKRPEYVEAHETTLMIPGTITDLLHLQMVEVKGTVDDIPLDPIRLTHLEEFRAGLVPMIDRLKQLQPLGGQKEYALQIQQLPPLFRPLFPGLYKLRGQLGSVDWPNWIYQQLADSALLKFQEEFGLRWWANVNPRLVISDFDLTLARDNLQPISDIVSQIRNKHEDGYEVVILTGRSPISQPLIETFSQDYLGFIPLIFCNPGERSLNHKVNTVGILIKGRTETIHFDSNPKVLDACQEKFKVGYFPIRV